MTVQAPPRHRHQATEPHTTPPTAPAYVRAGGLIVGLTVVLTVIFIAFALPAVRSKPHDVPLGVSGPATMTAQIQAALDHTAPGGFAVTRYTDQGALRTAIRDRSVYGGFALTPEGPTLLLATGGSPMIAQMLTQIGTAIQQQTGTSLRTEDLAPLPKDDPRGVGLAAAALPLTLAGLLPAVALLLVFKNEVWLRFGSAVVFAAVAALAIGTLLRDLFGSIDQHFTIVVAGLFLGALANGLAVLGLGSLFGRVGLMIGAVIAVLIGNPLSGLNGAPELLPHGWGAFGQLMPQGANATLLRSAAYFPDGFPDPRATTAIVVLCVWAAAGTVLIMLSALKRRHAGA